MHLQIRIFGVRLQFTIFYYPILRNQFDYILFNLQFGNRQHLYAEYMCRFSKDLETKEYISECQKKH